MNLATIACSVVVLAAAVKPAGDPLLPLHPTAAEVPGLVPAGDSQFCGGGDSLTEMYDGGYQRFVKAGVVRASRRYYTLGGTSVEVVVHQMATARAALDFLGSLCRDIKAGIESQHQAHVCMASGEGTSYGDVAVGPYLATASLDRETRQEIRALLKGIARRITESGKPTKISK